jgi:hypothetical protein
MTTLPTSPVEPTDGIGLGSRIATFLSKRSSIMLMLLMIQVGLVAGLWQAVSQLRATAPAGVTRGAGTSTCANMTVVFRSKATEHDISALLTQYGATIVYGPDENDAYLLQMPGAENHNAPLQALGHSPVVESADWSTVCR